MASDIPIDATLGWARDHDPDGGLAWRESMPIILAKYPQVTVADYWERLTVADHAYLLRHALGLPLTAPREEAADG